MVGDVTFVATPSNNAMLLLVTLRVGASGACVSTLMVQVLEKLVVLPLTSLEVTLKMCFEASASASVSV